jgi:mono/diheme cytochrome c family protein
VSDPVAAGEATYQKNCSSCHQATGKGVTGAFPPVVGSEWVTGPSETLVRILLHGLQGPVQVAGVTYNGAMPAWKDVLKDEEIAAVATYIRQWAPNAAPAVPPAEVTALRDAHADRAAAWTADELRAAVGTAPTPAPAGAAGAPGAAAGGTSTPPGQAGPQDRGVPAAGPGKGAPGVQGNAPGSPAGQPQDGRRGS